MIRWRDRALWPSVLASIPAGYDVARDRHAADERAYHLMNMLLPPRRAEHFATLWDTSLDTGLQPSGLLLACLAALPRPEGHASGITARRFGAFVLNHKLWHYVPGKLYPATCDTVPGDRLRAYVVLRPAGPHTD